MRAIACLLFMLSACTSQPVRCDGRLQPINRPAGAGAHIMGVAGPSRGTP